jgi:hypothetical protein
MDLVYPSAPEYDSGDRTSQRPVRVVETVGLREETDISQTDNLTTPLIVLSCGYANCSK